MTMLNRWNPMREFEELQRQFFQPFLRSFEQRGDLGARGWLPAVDVEETTDSIVVRAELPGMNPDDIRIDYDNGHLTISGERRFDEETKDRTYHRIERSYGTFTRSFVLPNTIDADQTNATFENGVLELVMPKREEARRKSIPISTTTHRQIEAGKSSDSAEASASGTSKVRAA